MTHSPKNDDVRIANGACVEARLGAVDLGRFGKPNPRTREFIALIRSKWCHLNEVSTSGAAGKWEFLLRAHGYVELAIEQ